MITGDELGADDFKNRLKMLVAVACYGTKNTELLQHVICQYQEMDLDVDIVVLSNIPRDLGSDVEVIVGLPAKNPWSLPFAHRPVFAERVDEYDLFAYTEDDIGVSEQSIRAFVRASAQLAEDEIAGFLRYEVDGRGVWSLPDVHGGYHWKPESVRNRGEYTVAEFTNEHAGFYLVTQKQLSAMIALDGFVRDPYEGRYDMLCSAATDPYTAYGFHKVICISMLDDFLIHHLSDRYAGQMGIPLDAVRGTVRTILEIAAGNHPASTLFDARTRWPDGRWAKNYYEVSCAPVLDLVPKGTRNLLSIGCGWGATEASLAERGVSVTAIPINSAILPHTSLPGINRLYGDFAYCADRLSDTQFDCVLICELLHLLPNPEQVINRCSKLVGENGCFVVSGPNFNSMRILAKRALNKGGLRKLQSFKEGGIHLVGPAMLKRYFKQVGFEITATHWWGGSRSPRDTGKCGRWGNTSWIVLASRVVA